MFGMSNETRLVLIVLAALCPFGIMLALIGTVLPATAIHGDSRLSTAFRRGKARFWSTLWRLIYGNVLFGIAALTLLTLATGLAETGTPDNRFVFLGLSFLASLISCMITLLAATALSMAYEETEPPLDGTG